MFRKHKHTPGCSRVYLLNETLIFCLFVLTWLLMLAANIITDVWIRTPSPVKLLRGHRLTLNCTATTPLNTRVAMTWRYPGEVSDLLFYFFYRTVFRFCKWDAKLSFWSEGENAEYSDASGRVNKGALGLVGCFSSLTCCEYDLQRYRLLMSGGFVWKCIGWYFYCTILGGKGNCFILGNESLGFRDEKEIYHNVPGRGYLL